MLLNHSLKVGNGLHIAKPSIRCCGFVMKIASLGVGLILPAIPTALLLLLLLLIVMEIMMRVVVMVTTN